MLIVLKSLKSFSKSSAWYCFGLIDHACYACISKTIPMASVSQRTINFEGKIRYEIELIGTVVQNYQDISLLLTKRRKGLCK